MQKAELKGNAEEEEEEEEAEEEADKIRGGENVHISI